MSSSWTARLTSCPLRQSYASRKCLKGACNLEGTPAKLAGYLQYAVLAQQRPSRGSLQPVDAGARGAKEYAPVLTPGQVRREFREENASQQFPGGATHPHAA